MSLFPKKSGITLNLTHTHTGHSLMIYVLGKCMFISSQMR